MVQAAELRPTFRPAVHHVVVFVREKGSNWLKEAQPGVPYIPPSNQQFTNKLGGGSYTPGMAPDVCSKGMAKMVPAGSDFVFQLHYTPNGKAGADQSKLGLVYASAPPHRRVITMAVIDFRLKIPPGEANHISTARTPNFYESTLTNFFPHMHVRGKSFQYEVVLPDGARQKLLNVPRYDFNWQFSYRLDPPIDLPVGAKIECTAMFDNSANKCRQSRSKGDCKVGRANNGRNDDRVLRPGCIERHEPGEVLASHAEETRGRLSFVRYAVLFALAVTVLPAHDFYSTKITWSREISRIVVKRCLGCHQTGGKAFSLASFDDARPWAKAIKEEVLNRRMPPWGAVKGFGEFRNDPSLAQEEIGLISDWVEGGSPEGEKVYLPDMKSGLFSKTAIKGRSLMFTGSMVLKHPASIIAVEPDQLGSSTQVVAELPDGSVEPLVWILDPVQAVHREYQYDSPVLLPKGARIVAPEGSWRIVIR